MTEDVQKTIGDALVAWGRDTPNAPALQSHSAPSLTYAQLVTAIDEIRSLLNSAGLGLGKRIGFSLTDSAQALMAYMALINTASAVPVNPQMTEIEAERLFVDLRLDALVVSDDLPAFADLATRLGIKVIKACPGATTGELRLDIDTTSNERAAAMTADDIACIQTSSGTTGRPKASLLSHSVLLRRVRDDGEILGLSPQDVTTNFRPPYLSGPLNIGLLGSVCAGGSVLVPPGFDADTFFDDLIRFKLTWYSGGPVYHRAILEAADRYPDAVLAHNLRFIRSAGYRLAGDLQDALEARFGVPCIQKYGGSESGLVACNPMPPGLRKTGTCGPVHGCEMRIVGDNNADVAKGAEGEIWVRGPAVFGGYVDPEMTNAAFEGDWFKTGDLGVQDTDGYLAITGRVSEIINRGGQKISPAEVEAAFTDLPCVADALCFPVPHATLGQTAGVAIVAAPGAELDPETLRGQVAPVLSRYKQPETILLADALPLGPTGKPLRKSAADWFGLSDAAVVAEQGHPPSDALERIWAKVLRLERVHPDQNFTRQGGDSLRAMQLILAMEETFQRVLPNDIVYGEGATLAGLRMALDAAPKVSETAGLRPDVPRRATPGGDVPLISNQQRLWTIGKAFPDVALYNSAFSLRFPSNVDLEALQKTADFMLARHEALRATFPDVQGMPVQRFIDHMRLVVDLIDVASERNLQDEIERIARAPFDLGAGPLVRYHVLRLPDVALLLHQTHHIISDATSTSILAREIPQVYAALSQGKEPDLPRLSCSFGDFVADMHNRMSPQEIARLKAAWIEKLDGIEPVLSLSSDRPRPSTRSHTGHRLRLDLGPDVTENLRNLARTCEASLFSTALAVFEVLVARLTGRDSFIIGTGIDTRPPEWRDQIVGFGVNTVPLAARPSDALRLSDHVRAVQNNLLWAQQNAAAPFSEIARTLAPGQTGVMSPLVQVMFGARPQGTRASDISQADGRGWNLDHDRARFDLTFMIEDSDDGLKGYVEYALDLFDRPTIQRLIDRYANLISRMSQNAHQLLSEISALDTEELDQITAFATGPVSQWPSTSNLVEQFANTVAAFGDQSALRQGDIDLSYADLDRWSDTVAAALMQSGIASQEVVGVSAERTPAAIAAILGIVKAGGAYLALEPDLPATRLGAMLEDADTRFVLCQLGSKLPVRDNVTRLEIPLQTDPRIAFKPALREADHLAYVCFTSGTTGRPKAVEIQDSAVLSRVSNPDYAQLGPGVRILQASSIAFDASTFDIWGALLTGATLVQPSEHKPSLTNLANVICDARITTMFLTAGLFRQMVDHQSACFTNVHAVMTGGEPVSVDHIRQLSQIAPDCAVSIVYGPTENTTFSLSGALPKGTKHSGAVPIGKPIANTTAWVLDRQMRPVPLGVEGDLWVGGAGVACRYRNRPDETAAAFVPDPFSSDPQARLYRTGDRACMMQDGWFDFRGRRDRQVKLRGFRIELTDIETALRDHPSIRDAAVIAKYDDGVARSLHGFVTTKQTCDVANLPEFLAQQLPQYMVPQSVQAIDAVPLTSTGKTDEAALRALMDKTLDDVDPDVAELSLAQAKMAAIWRGILPDAANIAPQTDFFMQGGDSLLSLQLAFRIEERFGVSLDQSALYRHGSLAAMTGLVMDEVLTTDVAGPLAEIWKNALGTEPDRPDLSFYAYGGTDLLMEQVLRRIREAWDLVLPSVDVFADPSFLGLTSAVLCARRADDPTVRPATNLTTEPVIALSDKTPDGHPVFVSSGAGGHVLSFVPVMRRLPDPWSSFGLLDPAFDPSHVQPGSVQDLAAEFADRMTDTQPGGPILVVGYSYGAHVGFEAARILRQSGHKAGLVAIDSKSRAEVGLNRKGTYKKTIRKALTRLGVATSPKTGPVLDPRWDTTTQTEANNRFAMGQLQRRLLARYTPQAADVPMVLLNTPRPDSGQTPDRGWAKIAQVIDIVEVPGTHLTVFKGQNEPGFAIQLDRALTTLRAHLEGTGETGSCV